MKILTHTTALLLTALLAFGGCGGKAPASGDSVETADTSGSARTVLYWRAPMNPDEIYTKPGKSKMGMDLVPVYADEVAAPTEDGRTVLYWRAPMNPDEIYTKPGKSKMGMDLVPVYADEAAGEDPTPAAAGEPARPDRERQILYWRAPMNPNEIYDKPGKSQMGMDLVPVYADEVAGEGTVAIDPVMMQNIGVRTARVAVAPLNRTVRTSGRFEMDEQGARTVTLKVGGWVEKLYADFEGAMVREGEPLLELYSPALVTTQEEYLLALRHAQAMAASTAPEARTDAERLLAAARRRLAYWDLSDEQIRRLETTGVPQRTITFYAPASGEVMAKNVTEGDHVEAGKPLMKIFDLRTVWLIVDVYEKDFPWITVGTPAQVELPYAPGRTYTGRVDYIYHMMAEETRTVRARITLPGGHHTPLKPGMYATVVLRGTPTAPSPVVPEEAVLMTGERALVILALGEGRFRPVEVTPGVQSDGMIQILDGLRGGEEVVTSAQFLIDSEARLKSAVSAMLGGSVETPDTDTVPTPDSIQ